MMGSDLLISWAGGIGAVKLVGPRNITTWDRDFLLVVTGS